MEPLFTSVEMEEQEPAAKISTGGMEMEEQEPAIEVRQGPPEEEKSTAVSDEGEEYCVPMAATPEKFGSYGALHTTSWDFQQERWVVKDSR